MIYCLLYYLAKRYLFMEELWKPIINYENFYEISNQGRIRSFDRIVNTKDERTYIKKGKILSPSKDKDGHLRIHLSKKGKLKYFQIHQLVFQAFTGQFVEQLDHKNRIKDDNHLTNLRPASASQNQENRTKPKNNTSGHKGV